MIKKYKQFNEGIKHLLVGPTKEEIEKDLKDNYFSGNITLRDYLKKCTENKISKPTKNEVLMKFGITDKFETDQINSGEDFINFIIDNTIPEKVTYIGEFFTKYKLYDITYYVINKTFKKIVVNNKIYDMLYIFDIYSVNERFDLIEDIFKKRNIINDYRFNILEHYLMFFFKQI